MTGHPDASTREAFLPFALPWIEEDEISEVVDSLRSGWISTGPKVKRFEDAFARFIGAPFAVALSSCTAALHLGLCIAGIGAGDQVITTPLTFASTANVVLHLGARPIFADIAPDLTIDPTEIARRITPRTKAIVPVHYAGQPCRMDEILSLAERHGLLVLEDSAHAVAAAYRGRRVGTIGDMTAFSFYAIKNLTTAEGGMLTLKDEALAQKARLMALHGMSRDAWKRYTSAGSWYYEIVYPGFKYNMTDIQASLGLVQLTKIEKMQAIRSRYAAMYNEAFASLPEIRVPVVRPEVEHAWHLYVIQIDPQALAIDRAQFIEALRAENIGTSVHFIPVHLHPYYRETFGYQRGDYPIAEAVYDRIISLPLYPKMTEADVQSVIAAVRRVVAHHRKA
jgi:dTDP-4-amino-4,6-dideoxygalactose transaminase